MADLLSLRNSRNPDEVNNALRAAREQAHLISPMTVCPGLPEGCEVSLALVYVNTETDTYKVQGTQKRALLKHKLEEIATAAGVSWDPQCSVRTDPGNEPSRCSYKAVGHYRQPDGSIITIVGDKEVDLREGSPLVVGVRQQQLEKAREIGKEKKWSEEFIQKYAKQRADNQIMQARLHVMSLAQSKARNRAIRSLGVKAAYDPAEFAKPFAVLRTVWTGKTDDPVLRRLFAMETARAFLGTREMLYGPPPRGIPVMDAEATEVPAKTDAGKSEPPKPAPAAEPAPKPAATAPKPAAAAPAPAATAPSPRPAPAAEPAGLPAAPERPETSMKVTIRTQGGGNPTLAEAVTADLEYWRDRIQKGKDEGTEEKRWAGKNTEKLNAINAELRYRKEIADFGTPEPLAGGEHLGDTGDDLNLDDIPF